MVLSPQLEESSRGVSPSGRLADDWTDIRFRAMGTDCRVLFRSPEARRKEEFQRHVVRWVEDFERKYSRFREDSMVSEINRNAGIAMVPTDGELESLLTLCDWFHWSTGGVFDPTALPLSELWDYHNPMPVLPDPDQIDRARALVGWHKVLRGKSSLMLSEKGMSLDLGGIGKEYAVDRVTEMAPEWGIRDIMVDFGRDIRVAGDGPLDGSWRIGLEHPLDPGRCWSAVLLRERALATSGDYLRGFETGGKFYGHIIDPRTGCPVDNSCRSVSVVAQTCTEAGILATAALVLGRVAGLKLISRSSAAQGCVWERDSPHLTPGFHRFLL